MTFCVHFAITRSAVGASESESAPMSAKDWGLSARGTRYLVLFESTYGSTESYAVECAARLGCTCHALHDGETLDTVLSQAMSERIAVIVFSPNYAGKIAGVKAARTLLDGAASKSADGDGNVGDNSGSDREPLTGLAGIALVAVGMTPPAIAREKDVLKGMLGSDADRVARFYLPGNLEYSRLSRVHRSIMWGMVKVLQKKPHPSAVEQNMIDGYGKDTVGVDFTELEPIVEWSRAQ